VVDDKEAVRATLGSRGIPVSDPPRLNFRDPSGNFVQVVDYRDIQFTKTPEVLAGWASRTCASAPANARGRCASPGGR
jgi:hypothetical protein